MSELDVVVSIALGVGLAAAVGFRVFLPLLVMSGAAYTGHPTLSDSFAWLATPAALAIVVLFCWLAVRFVDRLFRRTPAERIHD